MNAFDVTDTLETDILDEHMPEDPDYVPPSPAALKALEAGIKSAKTEPLVHRPRIRHKRTEQEMRDSFKGDPLSEAAYVRKRILNLEEKIAELLTNASDDARNLVLGTKACEHLKRYY